VRAAAAARFWCAAVKRGVQDAEIDREIQRRCPKEFQKQKVRVGTGSPIEVFGEARIALEFNTSLLGRMGVALGVVVGVLGGITLLGRVISPLRLISLAAAAIRPRLEGLVIEGTATRVRNQALIVEMRALEQLRRALD
jgi:hypothetical protein